MYYFLTIPALELFNKDTSIRSVPKKTQSSDENSASEKCKKPKNPEEASGGGTEIATSNESGTSDEEDSVVSIGKEACKEYIKSFLAVIPIRELQVDLKKGLMSSTPLHHRLQIEFHYTRCLQPVAQSLLIEATADELAISELVV